MIDEEDEDEEDDDWIKVDRGALEKPKMFEKDAEINHQLVVKKLIEIMAARGKFAVIVFCCTIPSNQLLRVLPASDFPQPN